MVLGRVRLSVAEARDLAEGALEGIGYHGDEARIIADHVIDAALCGYEYSGLAKILPVVVVSVHPEPGEAASIAERAIDYLRFHEIRAEAQPIHTRESASRVLLSECRRRKSAIMVMGSYGQSGLRELFLGSVTRDLLHESPVPLFLFH